MTTTIAPQGLDPRAALRDLFGFADFRPGQEEVVNAALAGADLLAVMPTGAGKSLCFQLPAFMLPGCAVVVSPLVALMKDQLDSLPAPLREQSAIFNSTLEREELEANLNALADGRLKLVYVAPERLRQRPFVHALARANISRVVVDEAHCISMWGQDFRPDYLFVPSVLDALGSPPVLAMTATATKQVAADIGTSLGRSLTRLHEGVLRPNLYLAAERVENKEAKFQRLVELCEAQRGPGIVYVSSRKDAEVVARILRNGGVNARHYHAGLERGDRAAVQDAFLNGRTRIIVATVAFGMGVDKADVRFIIHFSPSRSLEAYAQESGRAGRDGLPATCTLLWASSDKIQLGRWVRDDALTPELLNAVYRPIVRSARAEGDVAWWPLERLVNAAITTVKDADETAVRVALGALERVGVLRRHYDAPESFTVRPYQREHPSVARIAAAFAPGNRIDLFDLADALAVSPLAVEAVLLEARDGGALEYTGYGRGMLIERLRTPDDLRERLQRLLADYAAGQQARAAQIMDYAQQTCTCRAVVIARHFDAPHPPRCGNCDICVAPRHAPTPRAATRARPPVSQPERAPEDLILDCIDALPFPMGRTGVAKVLKGSTDSAVQADRSPHFGALAALTVSAIQREIEQLVEQGYLWRDDESDYRTLGITAAGADKPATPWPPPAPIVTSRRRVPLRAGNGTIEPDEALTDGPPDEGARFELLRGWRREVAQELNVPSFTVLHDSTLHLLASRQIRTRDDLRVIKGIGPTKLDAYGDALLDLLREPE